MREATNRINHWFDGFLRREAAKGKWRFVWRIGILAWSIPLVCGLNIWFHQLTNYAWLTVLVLSLIVCLPAGVVVGLGFYRNARRSPEELREFWRRQMMRGRASFVWRYGVIRYGFPLFIAFTIICLLTTGLRQGMAIVLFNALLWTAGGIVFGVILWSEANRKYQ
jgi:hypothetical protein